MPSNKIRLTCILHYINFPTWPLASFAPMQLLLSSVFQPYVDRRQSISACSNCNADWNKSNIHNVDKKVFTWSIETVVSLGWYINAGQLLWEDWSSTCTLFVGTIVKFASHYINEWWISSCWTHCKCNLESELNSVLLELLCKLGTGWLLFKRFRG